MWTDSGERTDEDHSVSESMNGHTWVPGCVWYRSLHEQEAVNRVSPSGLSAICDSDRPRFMFRMICICGSVVMLVSYLDVCVHFPHDLSCLCVAEHN